MTQSTIEAQVFARKLELQLPAKYEIDCDNDPDFGKLYRVWDTCNLCGTFYQDMDGYWVPQPVKCDFRPRLKSELQAQLVIIAVYENPCLQTLAN